MKYSVLMIFLIAPTLGWADEAKAKTPSSVNPAHDCRARYDIGEFTGAVPVCEEAARAGDMESQFRLGRMYEKGDGVSKDLEAALRLYRQAGEKGHAGAQRRVAAAYAFGLGGVKKDEGEARKWLTRAAEGGDTRAQKQLAEAYRRGLAGFPKDENLAREWSERAKRADGK